MVTTSPMNAMDAEPTRVLVVDDDGDACTALGAGLAAHGFRVTTETSAARALAFFEREELDVVVSDVAMEGMGGLELCERLRTVRVDAPIVLVSGFGSMDMVIAALRAGAADFLPRPFELAELVRLVGRAVAQARLARTVNRLEDRGAAEVRPFEELYRRERADARPLRPAHEDCPL